MSKLNHLPTAATRLLGNCIQGRAATVIGATASAITSTVAVVSVIDGITRAVAAFTNQALTALAPADLASSLANWLQPWGKAGFYVQPANTTVYYVVVVNAAGAIRVVQGTWNGQILTDPSGYTVTGVGDVPDIPDGVVPLAILKVASGGSTFTPGTTALTGLVTIFETSVLPSVAKP